MTTLVKLAAAYDRAKEAERRATEQRRALAAAIQELTGHSSERQSTYEEGGWKVTVKAPLITSMDWEKWERVQNEIPTNLWPVKSTLSIDMQGVKWLKNNEPDVYSRVENCLTIKPGAVQVTVAIAEGE